MTTISTNRDTVCNIICPLHAPNYSRIVWWLVGNYHEKPTLPHELQLNPSAKGINVGPAASPPVPASGTLDDKVVGDLW